MPYRNGIPKAPYRALDYAASSLGSILRNGTPQTPQGMANLADELDLIRKACHFAMVCGAHEPTATDYYHADELGEPEERAVTLLGSGQLRDIFLP